MLAMNAIAGRAGWLYDGGMQSVPSPAQAMPVNPGRGQRSLAHAAGAVFCAVAIVLFILYLGPVAAVMYFVEGFCITVLGAMQIHPRDMRGSLERVFALLCRTFAFANAVFTAMWLYELHREGGGNNRLWLALGMACFAAPQLLWFGKVRRSGPLVLLAMLAAPVFLLATVFWQLINPESWGV